MPLHLESLPEWNSPPEAHTSGRVQGVGGKGRVRGESPGKCSVRGRAHPSALSAVGPVTFRDRRRQVNLSQEQLALMLCVNHATISRWESGLRRPAHDMVSGVAEALRVPSTVVEAWFAHLPVLGGDTVGRLPGLRRLLCRRQIDLGDASSACGVSISDLTGWVHGRRSLPRFMVPRLARLLDMTEAQFRIESRISSAEEPGSHLRELRRRRGLTQRALGLRIGRSEAAICSWELGRVVPSWSSVRRLAEALSIDEGTLCERMAWTPPPPVASSADGLSPSELLKWRRLQEGMNCAQVARCVGVTAQTVRRWESGDFRPRHATLARLVRVLELPELQQMMLSG